MKRRIRKLLIEFQSNPRQSTNQLKKKLGLSTSQLSYTIEKVNEILKDSNIAAITQSEKEYIFNFSYVDELTQLIHKTHPTEYYSQEERLYIELILLFMRLKEDYIGLDYMASILNVTSNTISRDLKKLRDELTIYNIELKNNNIFGFYIEGNPNDIRVLLFKSIEKVTTEYSFVLSAILLPVVETTAEIDEIGHLIRTLEEKLQIKLSLQKNNELLVLSTILSNTGIDFTDSLPYVIDEEIDYTHSIVVNIFNPVFIISNNLKLVTNFILTSTFIYVKKDHSASHITSMVNQFVENLEYSGVHLRNKKKIKQLLYQHIYPMYYRILFDMQLTNPLSNYIKKNYEGLYSIVHSNLTKIDKLQGVMITDGEIAYITAILADSFDYTDTEEKGLKVAVVCQYGMSVSQLLKYEIKKRFPEFKLTSNISLNEINTIENEYDLIISTVSINTSIPLIIVDSNVEKINFDEVKKNIAKRFPNVFDNTDKKISQIMSIIENHIGTTSAQLIRNKIETVLYQQETLKNENYGLAHFLTFSHVQFHKGVSDYNDALNILCKPLIENKKISQSYLIHLQEKGFNQHIIIKSGIALPHIRDDDNVFSASMSLLKLEEPFIFEGNDIYIFLLLAGDEKMEHVHAIEELFILIENSEYYKQLMEIESYEDFIKLLEEVKMNE